MKIYKISYILDIFLFKTMVDEEVWVNRNGPNTEMVDFKRTQNCEKKFFPWSTGICKTCPKQGLHISNIILFHHVMRGWWIILFPKYYIFSKMVN